MKKDEIIKLSLIGLAIMAILTVMACTISIVMPEQRTPKAQTYDLECVAGRSRNPLQECKE